jgi:hypothetical protein
MMCSLAVCHQPTCTPSQRVNAYLPRPRSNLYFYISIEVYCLQILAISREKLLCVRFVRWLFVVNLPVRHLSVLTRTYPNPE